MKELPAFSTNKFEVGDIIKIYRSSKTFISTVESIDGDIVIVTDGYQYHFKQCRFLVKECNCSKRRRK